MSTTYVDRHYARITQSKLNKETRIRNGLLRWIRSGLEASTELEFHLTIRREDVDLVIEFFPGIMEEINEGETEHPLLAKFVYNRKKEEATGGWLRVFYEPQCAAPPPQIPSFLVAIRDHTAGDLDELSFVAGDRLEVIVPHNYWPKCRLNGKTGYVGMSHLSQT